MQSLRVICNGLIQTTTRRFGVRSDPWHGAGVSAEHGGTPGWPPGTVRQGARVAGLC